MKTCFLFSSCIDGLIERCLIVVDAVCCQLITMFAGYENFSTYFVDADDIAASDVEGEFAGFPNELKPCFPAVDPWFAGSACSADFIVVAEFSELEGPVPRVCIYVQYMYTFYLLINFNK